MESENYQNNNSVMRCACGTPLVKRLDSRKFEFAKFHNGKPVKFTVEHSGDKFDVHCKKCGRNITFATNSVQLGLSYVIALPKT
jgi:hypothetical protein